MILDVTTQPQAINLAGIQDDSLLYNAGPDTIYVDTNGSVSASLSIPIPALTYLPWRTGVPLWVVSRGYSRLVATSTYDAPSTSGSARQQRILSELPFSAPTALAECSAYETLIISYRIIKAWAISGTPLIWTVDWYDSDQTFMERTTLVMQPPLNSSDAAGAAYRWSRMQVPVRGAFFTVDTTASDVIPELNVVGLTQQRSLLLSTSLDTSASTPPDTPDIPIRIDGSGTINSWGEDWAMCTLAGSYPNIFVKSLKRNLRVSFDWQVASDPTGAGSIALVSAHNGDRLSANKTIAAATRGQEYDFILPMSSPAYVDFTSNPVSVNNPVIMFTWSD